MQKSKLFLLLKTFTSREWNDFDLFLRSPYFNRDPRLVQIFEKLRDGLEKVTDRAALHHLVFPEESYRDDIFRQLISRLNQKSEEFLGIRRLQRSSTEMAFASMDELSERGLEKAYQRIQRETLFKLDGINHTDKNKLLDRLRLEEIRQRHFERSHQRVHDLTVQHLAEYLDRYYYLYRLYISCAMLDHQTIFETDYELNLTDQWVRHVEEMDYWKEPIIKIFYTVFKALEEKEQEQHFDTLKAYMVDFSEQISAQDLKDIYLFAINYCARKIRQGQKKYIPEALDLYIKGVQAKVLLENGYLSPWTFANMIKLALRLEKFKWIENFMDTYGPELIPEFRENALHYNRAELYYATKRYGLAQRELIQVALTDLSYYIGARVLLAKIYYETREEESLLSLIASFTIFLKRNKNISISIKQACLNFCQVLFQIVRKGPNHTEQIKTKINQLELLTERDWLIQSLSNA